MTYDVMMFSRATNSLMYQMSVIAYSVEDAIKRAIKITRSNGEYGLYAGSAYPSVR